MGPNTGLSVYGGFIDQSKLWGLRWDIIFGCKNKIVRWFLIKLLTLVRWVLVTDWYGLESWNQWMLSFHIIKVVKVKFCYVCHCCACTVIRDGQNDSFPGTRSFSSVHYNDLFIWFGRCDSFVMSDYVLKKITYFILNWSWVRTGPSRPRSAVWSTCYIE